MSNDMLKQMIELIIAQTPSVILAVESDGKIGEIFLSNIEGWRKKRFLGQPFEKMLHVIFPDAVTEILPMYHEAKKQRTEQMVCRHEHTTAHELPEYYCWNFYPWEDKILVYIRNITESVLMETEFTSITAQYQNVNEELYTAMSNQDLFLMDLEQTKKQLVALYRITSIVQKTVDEEEVLEEILKNVTKEFALDNVAILLLDKENQELVVRAHTGYFQTFCKFLRIPLGQGIAGHAAKYREVVFSPDVSQDHRYISGGIDCVSELAIPLIVNDQVIGVFDIETTCKRDFSELELEMFGSLANQIAMTIAHANHVASVEVQAITDGMTGLFNYRYFRTLLTQEFKRSKRYHRPLSLLMMDIDNFKSYNDRHGHQQGDYLLRTIAELIRHIVRDVDFVVRYGGEEFAVILPETPLHDAVIIAERIRQSIAEYPFDNRETQPNGIISVSTGLASFPRDADSDVELIQHADAAMYAAKQNDKNCVRVFHEIATG